MKTDKSAGVVAVTSTDLAAAPESALATTALAVAESVASKAAPESERQVSYQEGPMAS